ncbi:MAG TPA: cupin domain-containing protein [Candidatus Acidoferrales bacterium]|jgi:mannose-6-phosphate isomerase-like protein (cupin superfamily)|nr:cupin domain-containing protein [Candidatus Acidoferrales bacterium]
MRATLIGLVLTLAAAVALAKQPAAKPSPQPNPQSNAKPTQLFTSASDVTALIAKAKGRRTNNQPLITEPILELGGYDGHLEYRASVGNAAVHEKEAELFYVLDGSATLVTGGKLVNEKRTDAANLNGSAIEGGSPRNIAKGDWVLVPQDTAHWFSPIHGVLVLFSMHVPGDFTPAH